MPWIPTFMQASQARPLINVRMLAERRVALTNLAMIFLALGAINLGQMLSLLLQQPAWTGIGLGLYIVRTLIDRLLLGLSGMMDGQVAAVRDARRSSNWSRPRCAAPSATDC